MPTSATATVETYAVLHALSSPSSQRSEAYDFDTNAKEDRLVRFLAQTVHPKIEHIPPFRLSDIVDEPLSSFPALQKISRIGEFRADLPRQLHGLITEKKNLPRPHPHNLVGRHCRGGGVCTVEINSESMTETFSNLGIQCVKKRDIDEALRIRQEQRVDPYRSESLRSI